MLIRIFCISVATLSLVGCAQESEAPADVAGAAAGVAANAVNSASQTAGNAVAAAQSASANVAAAVNAATGDLEARIAAADADKGQRYFIFCQACHTLNEGGMNKVGPNLHGVINREAAAAPGFIYSDALASSGLTWDAATLDSWITRPSALVPGTTMVFAGIQDPAQRADLLAYIKQATAAQ